MARMFAAYLMVDWSAAAAPVTGKNSIWIALGTPRMRIVRNPPTRHAAMRLIVRLLRECLARGRRVLVGFDFPFGFPTGCAARLGLNPASWRGVWRELARLFTDQPNNGNRRFQAAAGLNRRLGGAGPFWGRPESAHAPGLATRKPATDWAKLGFAERRHTDRRPETRAAKSIWQLAYNGSVGSQAMLGIKHLLALRDHPALARRIAVWPFERITRRARVVLAEIWPSLPAWRIDPGAHSPKDRAQVVGVVKRLAALDGAARLAPRFTPRWTPRERSAARREEAWILGVR
jgi:precorrin-8X/cobalt-precorrin-8 methylmutase